MWSHRFKFIFVSALAMSAAILTASTSAYMISPGVSEKELTQPLKDHAKAEPESQQVPQKMTLEKNETPKAVVAQEKMESKEVIDQNSSATQQLAETSPKKVTKETSLKRNESTQTAIAQEKIQAKEAIPQKSSSTPQLAETSSNKAPEGATFENKEPIKAVAAQQANESQKARIQKQTSPNGSTAKTAGIYAAKTSLSQGKKNLFFQTNLGIGCLRFSGVTGNLMGRPVVNFQTNFRDVPYEGPLMYNKSILFEYLLGYRYNMWFKTALSYQHEGGIAVSTPALFAYQRPAGTKVADSKVQLTSNLALDGIMLKFYFESPWGLKMKQVIAAPYFGIGLGAGWQNWSQIQVFYDSATTTHFVERLVLAQKMSANVLWGLDLGFKMNDPLSNQFSMVLGCKYNQWGQARNIGAMSAQGSHKFSLTQPFRIKTIYQFAPYLGVQWNFPNTFVSQCGYKLKCKNPNTWKPYWVLANTFQPQKSFWTQFNVGVGCLYFSGVRANFMVRPRADIGANASFRDVPFKRGLTYNRTPLFEYLIGYQVNSWLKPALSIQTQNGVTVSSQALPAYENASGTLGASSAQFISNLSLNAILLKCYFELPWAMIFKNTSTSPYLALGVGPGWQSWTNIRPNYASAPSNIYQGKLMPIQQTISANAVWMWDLGLRVQGTQPTNNFSMLVGCKYNEWGQARNIGKMTHQGSFKNSFAQPLRIKTVYQFSPYLGVQWNFTDSYTSQSTYRLKGKSPNVWKPYFVQAKALQCKTSLWTQFNMGIGFLYFSRVRGNLQLIPTAQFLPGSRGRDVPLKGKLSYNRSPLYEYLLGYRFLQYFKVALSIQHQSGVDISTQALWAYQNSAVTTYHSVKGQFQSHLELNALLLKVYFESPWAMIWKNLSTIPQLAFGVGPGWQSWTNIQVNELAISGGATGSLFNEAHTLGEKISANAVFMVDLGFKVKSAYPNNAFSVLFGCKYDLWGQARNMGKLSQQGSQKYGLSEPFTIRAVYQFAPYLGVQWNF